MNSFIFKNDSLHAENVALNTIADTFGTPCYVYSKSALVHAFESFSAGFKGSNHLVCFAVKANPSLAILNLFAKLGAGFDIVSGGELARVLAAGGDPKKIVFSGVGKTEAEMQAALNAGIFCFNVESASELIRLNKVASDMGKVAPVSLRVNPNVDAKTHPYISTGLKNNKFGVAYEDALNIYLQAAAMPGISIHGVDCHIGSQITELSPFLDAFDKVLLLVDALEQHGISIQHIDAGGGIGICYSDETPPEFTDYAAAMRAKLGNRNTKLVFEPGRALVGNAGVLLTKVEYLKHTESKNFAIVDAAMNDLMRPALYDAYHDIKAVQPRNDANALTYEIVGPVCESGDFLGHDRDLSLVEGDLLAIMSAGAYGMSMASNYNTRPRAAEVMVDGDTCHLIRKREEIANLFALENILPET
ncbi:MAG: diaminopimelate decarboxylase [Methylotenera sp.]|uniref:diaminopimelate decarboxylase n=1 Tax=Methylotenera sp. TaxID=2051956 RepID=UPI002731BCCE|nr:diaminopimelate decarboxylase [Methylotenera sp.]MDP1523399.1 diaminopimelate decarboxylase [Methylotenera sp.]MDP2070536.1 diaminopimelate decarboxylase [Methylotenera sp.]MDP3306793.1 diaminopimelate decarboxylase [Methylotenera sp.]MDP3819745.1 diaminopimelate decarboxylase [Methylotenera sp.]MDZ4212091.1 diaminopimelate decarboxylase [Methylotenera sp.]